LSAYYTKAATFPCYTYFRMKPAHLPRRFAAFSIAILGLAFLVGNVLAFSGVHAAPVLTPTPSTLPTVTAVPPTPTPLPIPPSADTTGILILGILLVAVILIGLLWGRRLIRR
jgi:ABC-type antimicrobial peptide transport system permease subunit